MKEHSKQDTVPVVGSRVRQENLQGNLLLINVHLYAMYNIKTDQMSPGLP